jgi:hypothetical protein
VLAHGSDNELQKISDTGLARVNCYKRIIACSIYYNMDAAISDLSVGQMVSKRQLAIC